MSLGRIFFLCFLFLALTIIFFRGDTGESVAEALRHFHVKTSKTSKRAHDVCCCAFLGIPVEKLQPTAVSLQVKHVLHLALDEAPVEDLAQSIQHVTYFSVILFPSAKLVMFRIYRLSLKNKVCSLLKKRFIISVNFAQMWI